MGKHKSVVLPILERGMDSNFSLNSSIDEGKKALKMHDKKKKKTADEVIVLEPMEELGIEFKGVDMDNATEKNAVASKKHGKKGKTKVREYEAIGKSEAMIRTSSTGISTELQDSKWANLERNEKEAEVEIEKRKKKRRKRSCDKDTNCSSPELSVRGLDGMNDTKSIVMDVRKDEQKKMDYSDCKVEGRIAELHVDIHAISNTSGDRKKRYDNTSELGKNLTENEKERKKKHKSSKSVESNFREVSTDGSVDERNKSAGKRKREDFDSERDERNATEKAKKVLNTESETTNDGFKGTSSTRTASDEKGKGKKEKEGGKTGKKNLLRKGFSDKEMDVAESSIGKSKKALDTPCVQKVASTENAKIAESKKKSRRVSFSGEVKVFPPPSDTSREKDGNEGLVQGKRFTPEEDEKVKEAVLKYIETNQLGDMGLHMVLNCRKFPEVNECWKDIGASLPWRPHNSVYHRAHVLFQQSEKRKWNAEEYETLRRFHEQNGSDWKTLGEMLGKHRFHVKDAWRRIKLPNLKKGKWSQDEYQALFDLVNMDLRMSAFDEKNNKHGMLRDNISWEAISQKLSTRYNAACCMKWYTQLASPLVSAGLWANSDDYRLMDALHNLDACCVEDVDWDNLLEHRSGDICCKRWDEMVRHIGGHREKSFIEQVEVLSKRYCPDMLEYRP